MATDAPRILVLPAGGRPWLADAVRAGGGEPVTEGEADAVVWTDPRDADGLRRLLDEQPGGREVLHGLRPDDGPGRAALHELRHRAAGRRPVLRRLRYPDRGVAAPGWPR